MPLAHLVVLATLHGLTEALPVSSSGHALVAKLWLDPSALDSSLAPVLHLGAALGLAYAARQRLLEALADGGRAITRSGIFRTSPGAHDAFVVVVGAVVSLLVAVLVSPHTEVFAASPTAAGAGLCLTGVGLASTLLAPAHASRPGVGLGGAALAGIAHGLAGFPGGSRAAAALTVLLWIGVKPARAVDLALLLSASALILAVARGAHGWPGTSHAALGFSLAFGGVLAGAALLRSLVERRRTAALALWTFPLGLALLAYAHALPDSP